MDGYSHHDHKKRDLQVSKRGGKMCKGKRHKLNMGAKWGIDQGYGAVNIYHPCIFICICYLRITLICVWVINKPCARETEYMSLIYWICHRGSKQLASKFPKGSNNFFLYH